MFYEILFQILFPLSLSTFSNTLSLALRDVKTVTPFSPPKSHRYGWILHLHVLKRISQDISHVPMEPPTFNVG